MLVLKDVSSGYGPMSIVQGVSLRVGPSEIVALLGKNGMGKTSLLKTILGLVPMRQGNVHVGGADATAMTPGGLIA